MKRNLVSARTMQPDDETAVSEITILPDGRIFVLGASRPVLEILAVLGPEDAGLKRRLEHLGARECGGNLEKMGDVKISGRWTNSSQEHRPL